MGREMPPISPRERAIRHYMISRIFLGQLMMNDKGHFHSHEMASKPSEDLMVSLSIGARAAGGADRRRRYRYFATAPRSAFAPAE